MPYPTPRPPKVTLMTSTQYPIETLYCAWMASREESDAYNNPADWHKRIVEAETALCKSPENCDDEMCPKCIAGAHSDLYNSVFEIFKKVVDLKISIVENIDFVFMLEDVSISWREQAVRHRIGVKVGARLGCDFIPELDTSTWWAQTMRVMDMGKYFEEGHFLLPETVEEVYDKPTGLMVRQGRGEREASVGEVYHNALMHSQIAYAALVKAGVPAEDARNVIPLGATHRLTWKLNLSSLMHILGKRGCWILQLGVWGPVIKQMVEELATKVHPYFRTLIDPPCIKNNKFDACVFKLENENRVTGKDPIPPCPLYLHNHEKEARDVAFHGEVDNRWVPLTIDGKHGSVYMGDLAGWKAPNDRSEDAMGRMRTAYGKLWNRNVDTGEPIEQAT